MSSARAGSQALERCSGKAVAKMRSTGAGGGDLHSLAAPVWLGDPGGDNSVSGRRCGAPVHCPCVYLPLFLPAFAKQA